MGDSRAAALLRTLRRCCLDRDGPGEHFRGIGEQQWCRPRNAELGDLRSTYVHGGRVRRWSRWSGTDGCSLVSEQSREVVLQERLGRLDFVVRTTLSAWFGGGRYHARGVPEAEEPVSAVIDALIWRASLSAASLSAASPVARQERWPRRTEPGACPRDDCRGDPAIDRGPPDSRPMPLDGHETGGLLSSNPRC